ncbi:hypothetical protein HY637_03760 [Candidatus Woesearchaeota archaeon]|nr:hypothetical protein [Candidatus Woesearchaeota archaeon]
MDFKSPEDIRGNVFTYLSSRGSNYKWFLRALRVFKYLSGNSDRRTFLESYYLNEDY